MSSNKTAWLTDKLKAPGFRRSFECGLLAEAAVTPLEQAKDLTQTSLAVLSAKTGLTATRLREIFADPVRMTLAELVDIALAFDRRVVVSVRPLDDTELKLTDTENGVAVTVS